MRLRTPLAVLAASVLAISAAGCRRPEGPDAAYRTFAAAARAGDSGQVYGLLSERSREALDARAKALSGKVPGTPASGRELALGDLAAGAPRIAKVVVLRESADAAVVGVTVEGVEKQEEVRMAREGAHWRVVLPEVAGTDP